MMNLRLAANFITGTIDRRRRLEQACALLVLVPGLLGGEAPTGSTSPAPGNFTFIHDEVPEGPWSVHLFRVTRASTDWEIYSAMGKGTYLGMATVPEQIKSLPSDLGHPVGAINGDFYEDTKDYSGDPEGLQIVRGELVSAPHPERVCFWKDRQGGFHRTNVLGKFTVTWPDGTTAPFGLNERRSSESIVLYTAAIGQSTRTSGGREFILERDGNQTWLPLRISQTCPARVREVRESGNAPVTPDTMVLSVGARILSRVPVIEVGAVLQISTATVPDLREAVTAIGGGPTLVEGGKAREWGGFQIRHPRSAIGWNKDYLYLIQVDGRQMTSVGMTYSELANYTAKLGCDEAMNLDGGGSATLWAYGSVVNSPSEGRERPAANSLVVVLKPSPAQ